MEGGDWLKAQPLVGFYLQDTAGNKKEATVSRSNLGKIVSSRSADRLIMQGIIGHANMPLREALETQIPGHVHSTRSQPYVQQTQPLLNAQPPQQIVPPAALLDMLQALSSYQTQPQTQPQPFCHS